MKHYAYNSPFQMKDKEGNNYRLTIKQDDTAENPRDWSNVGTMVCWHRHYNLGDKHNYDDVHEMLEDLAGQVGIDYEGLNTPDLMSKLAPYYCIKPLYLYDHGGITISTSNGYPYNDRWDAGCIGFIYVSKVDAFNNYGGVYVLDGNGERIKEEHKHEGHSSTWSYKTTPLTNDNWRKCASEHLDSEVKVYDQYLRGDVYGYVLEKKELVEEKCPHCGDVIKSYIGWAEDDSCWGFYGDVVEENGILDQISSDLKFID